MIFTDLAKVVRTVIFVFGLVGVVIKCERALKE